MEALLATRKRSLFMTVYQKNTRIDAARNDLAAWHWRPGAFQRLSPPWESAEVLREPEAIKNGERAEISVRLLVPIRARWIAEHDNCRPGQGFIDYQIKGPFAAWKHEHRFHDVGPGQSELEDEVAYRLPLNPLGKWIAGRWVGRKLERTFAYRHHVTKMDLERLAGELMAPEPLTILVTGATGMIGRALETTLKMRGHRVRQVTRRPRRAGDVRWDPSSGELELTDDDPVEAVVHLAGENIAGGRWTQRRKERILESRREGTRLLCQRLASLHRPPRVLVSVSGVNYYELGSEEAQDESADSGESFLAEVCRAWEGETVAAESAGIRVARLRLGMVLSPAGGALGKMLLPFRLGLAGRLGSGRQGMPWIALDDVVDLMHRAIVDPRYEGAINAVAPEAVSNAEFTRTLGRVMGCSTCVPVPAFLLRTVLGRELANEVLLGDLKVRPGRLESLGYPFRYPRLKEALAVMLGKSESSESSGH